MPGPGPPFRRLRRASRLPRFSASAPPDAAAATVGPGMPRSCGVSRDRSRPYPPIDFDPSAQGPVRLEDPSYPLLPVARLRPPDAGACRPACRHCARGTAALCSAPVCPRSPRVPGRMASFLQFEGVSKSFGALRAVDSVSLGIEKGEFFSLLGPERLRQDDAAAHAGRLRDARRRAHPPRRRGHHRAAAEPPQGQHDLPELRALPAPHGAREHRLRPARRAAAEARDRRARSGACSP